MKSWSQLGQSGVTSSVGLDGALRPVEHVGDFLVCIEALSHVLILSQSGIGHQQGFRHSVKTTKAAA